jgi:hypothetical protein
MEVSRERTGAAIRLVARLPKRELPMFPAGREMGSGAAGSAGGVAGSQELLRRPGRLVAR